jgi:hypothetical protein
MLQLVIKEVISGVVIGTVSEIAKRSPVFGALVVSLPLVSILSLIWLRQETNSVERTASLAENTVWFVLPTLPMFLVLPALLPCWPAVPSRLRSTFWPRGCFQNSVSRSDPAHAPRRLTHPRDLVGKLDVLAALLEAGSTSKMG